MQVANVNFGYRSAEITLSNGHLTVSKTFGNRPVEKLRHKLTEPIRSIDFSDEYINTHNVINEEESKRCFVNKFDIPEGYKLIGFHGSIGNCFGKKYITRFGMITAKDI